MEEFKNAVKKWISENAEDIVASVQDFARIRSVSRADLAEENAPFGPECREMLTHALEKAARMDFETRDYEGYCGSATLGDPDNAIGIVAHLDVVPEGDKWVYPPYAATRVGDFLIGRGVADNKSAAIMGLYIMKMFRELGTPLKHGIRVIMGCSEETGMQDMRYFRKHYKLPVVSLIPDSAFPVNYAQKGSMSGNMRISLGEQIISFTGGEVPNMVPPHATVKLRGVFSDKLELGAEFSVTDEAEGAVVVAHGVAAHAARPEGGRSAINMLASALADCGALSGQSLAAMRAVAEMTGDYYGASAGIAAEDEDTGKTTMVVGVAKMKNDSLSLSLDCRLSLAADRANNVEAFKAYCDKLGFTAGNMSTTAPVYVPKDDPRIVALTELYAELTGERLEPYTMGGGTYARELENAITFGPGFPGLKEKPELPEHHGGAHGPDEFMHIPSALRAFEIYACAIKSLDEVI